MITFFAFLIILAALLVLNAAMIAPYIIAVVTGGILALISRPAFLKLKKHGFSSRIASLVMVLGITVAIIAPLGLFVNEAVHQGIGFSERLAKGETVQVQDWIHRAENITAVQRIFGSSDQLENRVRNGLREGGTKASTVLLALLGKIPDVLLQIALALIACYFFLIDGPRFLSWLDDKLPLDREVRRGLYGSFKNTAVSTLWATLTVSVAHVILVVTAFSILKVPAAFLAGGAAFIFAWIPIIGTSPIWVAGALYLYFKSRVVAGISLVVLGGLAGVMDYSIRPLILKGRSDIHPLIGLLSIFGGIQMFGILGVFFGPILAGVLISLLNVWPSVAQRQQTATVKEQHPKKAA